MDSFLDVVSLAVNNFQLWLVDDSLQVAYEVGQLGSEGCVNSYTDGFLNDASDVEISKSDSLSNEESAC